MRWKASASLKDRNESVRNHIDQAVACSTTSSALVVGVEERAAATGNDTAQATSAWASESFAACDRIATAQAASLQASRQVDTAATANVDALMSIVARLQASQDAVQPKWSAATDAITVAVASWRDQEKASVCALDEVASKTERTLQEALVWRQEVAEQCMEAEEQVAERAKEDQQHSAVLAGMEQFQRHCSQEDIAAETLRLCDLSALGEGALAIATMAAQCLPKTDNLLTATEHEAAAGTAAAKALGASLAATGVAMAELAPQAEAASNQIIQGIERFRASGVEVYQTTARSADEVAREVSAALKKASNTLESQRMAFAVSGAASEDRWLELERSHGDVLKVAAAAIAGTSTASGPQGSGMEECAQEAQRKALAELEGHRSQLVDVLVEHQRLWRAGLSKKPMCAWTGEGIFQEQIAIELNCKTDPPHSEVFDKLAVQRSSEQRLSAELHANRGQCELQRAHMPKEEEIRNNSSVKFGCSHSSEEASGGSRLALRELQFRDAPYL